MLRSIIVAGRVYLKEQRWDLYVSHFPAESAMESEGRTCGQRCSTKQRWTWFEANARAVQSPCLVYQGLADQREAG
jgi:hypothetical protein